MNRLLRDVQYNRIVFKIHLEKKRVQRYKIMDEDETLNDGSFLQEAAYA